MNGLKYLAIMLLLAVPCCFAATKKTAKNAPKEEAIEVIEETAEPIEISTPSFEHKELCRLEQPMLVPGETTTTVEESCPPSCFTICKTVRSRQNFRIEGGCKKECVKCDPSGVCRVVPCNECCKPACCPKPCCKRQSCKPCCKRVHQHRHNCCK